MIVRRFGILQWCAQFMARDFKEFIRITRLTHVRTSPYYPQSNGKMERWYRSLKGEWLRVKTPLTLEDAERLVDEYVVYYNRVRLHSALGYITPKDHLEGRAEAIFAERKRKLEAAAGRAKNAATTGGEERANWYCRPSRSGSVNHQGYSPPPFPR